ncbi:hypothetical protein QE152_g9415 [Popillia japonica]|uniref:Uncharacterized protein n=1 Tax=Popillia japonica TaxID=7064 RepID=A0AAW1LUY5_POPJA
MEVVETNVNSVILDTMSVKHPRMCCSDLEDNDVSEIRNTSPNVSPSIPLDLCSINPLPIAVDGIATIDESTSSGDNFPDRQIGTNNVLSRGECLPELLKLWALQYHINHKARTIKVMGATISY